VVGGVVVVGHVRLLIFLFGVWLAQFAVGRWDYTFFVVVVALSDFTASGLSLTPFFGLSGV
jgi:hypothetical protein